MIKGVFHQRIPLLLVNSCRMYATAPKVEKSALSSLRKKTGFSFVNCRKALEQFDNDIEKAEEWLKEQAQKEGWAKATKLQNRAMSQGLIAVMGNDQAATMVEVNCETDFVARNNKFIDLTTLLAQECHQFLLHQPASSVFMDRSALGETLASTGQTLSDIVALEVANIGENMALRRAVHFKAGQSTISSYVHASGPEITTDADCRLGKYGVLVLLHRLQQQQQQEVFQAGDQLPIQEAGLLLSQHIVGMNPRTVGSLEEEESDQEDKSTEQEEEDRLVHQEFLLDPSITAGHFLAQNGIAVQTFSRFACGEELPEDNQ